MKKRPVIAIAGLALLGALLCGGAAAAAKETAPSPLRMHRRMAKNPVEGGWHLAVSTEGKFSAKLPGPFNDFTLDDNGDVSHFVASADARGTKYVAIFAPAKENKTLIERFDRDLAAKNGTIGKFRGYTAINSRQAVQGTDGAGAGTILRFRTPRGVFILMVIAPAAVEDQALRNKDAFFNSIDVGAE